MTRYPLTLTEPQIEWIEAEAAHFGVSSAELVRRIIDAYRAEIEKERGVRLCHGKTNG